ncbi:hypothetical protein INT47_010166 [Mucor saturninus]|uniref:Uncharacterized protein n=1 Tax=Mucor saturninus TaxID=64648 RepID=A0A8H7RDR0_9FUNG|nr:hypothetical protein INT47_010166 [Mucor saturninus]
MTSLREAADMPLASTAIDVITQSIRLINDNEAQYDPLASRRRTFDTSNQPDIESQLFSRSKKHQKITRASIDKFGNRIAEYLGLPPKVVNVEEELQGVPAFNAWEEFIVSFAKAYLVFKGINPDPVTITQENPAIKEKEEFMYCTNCSSLPVALIEVGMFPLSNLQQPSGAVHFSVCDYFDRMRKAFDGSGKQTADFYNALHGKDKPLLSARNCADIILLYRRMMEVSGEWPSTDNESDEE